MKTDWKAEYTRLTSTVPTKEEKHRPIIAITGNYNDTNCTLAEGYYRSVLLAGGTPLIIPPTESVDNLTSLLDRIDGLLLSGGADINPLLLGEEPVRELHGINPRRDLQELLLVRLAADRQIPILGICRGIQVMNAALGGELYQDINTQMEGRRIKHDQDLDRAYPSHTVSITPDTLLHSIFNTDRLAVNSFHHQAVSIPAPGLRISAQSDDGVIEAVESCEHKSILGVQWHPECFCLNQDSSMAPLFQWLVTEARSFAEAKRIHSRILTLDSHCDTPMFFHLKPDFATRDPRILVDLHKMAEGHLDASIMVAYLKQEARDEASLLAAINKTNGILDQIEDMVAKAGADHCAIARTPADLYRLKHEGKRAIMLGVENGYGIGKDVYQIQQLRKRGVVYMTLCHNGDNDICDSARGNNEHGGVSPFGEQVIREMNRIGMMVDLSHASEKSFYDALDISQTPIVCSHSSARALCDHPRNLTDRQMRELARRGGVMQVTLYSGFLRTDGTASILDAIDHINHAVQIMGIDRVGIGTDFDGDGGVPGCASASELINLTRRLLRQRYSEDDLRLIWGGNFLRVMEEVQQAADTPY